METIELGDVPNNTKIKVMDKKVRVPPFAPPVETGTILNFHHLDGMYSYNTDEDGNVVHIVAWSKVQIIK